MSVQAYEALLMVYALNGYTIKEIEGGRQCLWLPVKKPYQELRLKEACAKMIEKNKEMLITVPGGYLLPVDKIAGELGKDKDFMDVIKKT